MVYHTQNYWGFELFPSSGILGTRRHDVSEIGSVSVLRCGGKTRTQFGPPHRAKHKNTARGSGFLGVRGQTITEGHKHRDLVLQVEGWT
jgi:hypothetical protein